MGGVSQEDAAAPKGIYYDAVKRLYRVRLYLKGKVCWLEYHRTLNDALRSLEKGLAHRARLEREGDALPPRHVKELL